MEKKKYPAMYARVSSRTQQDEETIKSQILALREYLAGIGLDPDKDVLWYIDDGISGATSFYNRGGSSQLMEDARAGLIEYMAVFSISRLSRKDDYDFFVFARELRKMGIHIRSTSQNINTAEPGGTLMAGLLALLAAEQHSQMSQASRAGRLRSAREGNWPGRTPFGYDKKGGKLVTNEDEAKIVIEIFNLYAKEKWGMRKIAKYLKSRAVPGRKWARSTINTILSNTTYVGRGYLNVVHYVMEGKKKIRCKRPAEEWIEIPTPRIISDEVFESAKFVKAKRLNRLSKPQSGVNQYILPLVECLMCGVKYHKRSQHYSNKKRKTYYSYSHDGRRSSCKQANKGISRDRLEVPVWEQIEALIQEPELWQEHVKPSRFGLELKEEELKKIKKALRENDKSLERLEDSYFRRGSISSDRYDALSADIYRQRKQLENRRFELASILQNQQEESEKIQRMQEYLVSLKEAGSTATPLERREIVSALIKRVLIKAEGKGMGKKVEIVIEWRE